MQCPHTQSMRGTGHQELLVFVLPAHLCLPSIAAIAQLGSPLGKLACANRALLLHPTSKPQEIALFSRETEGNRVSKRNEEEEK